MEVKDIEVGKNYITLYFSKGCEALLYANKLYRIFKRSKHYDLQRKDFTHIKGDVPIFHPKGDPIETGRKYIAHFHIIYPEKPTEEDWEELYKLTNNFGLILNRYLEKKDV